MFRIPSAAPVDPKWLIGDHHIIGPCTYHQVQICPQKNFLPKGPLHLEKLFCCLHPEDTIWGVFWLQCAPNGQIGLFFFNAVTTLALVNGKLSKRESSAFDKCMLQFFTRNAFWATFAPCETLGICLSVNFPFEFCNKSFRFDIKEDGTAPS